MTHNEKIEKAQSALINGDTVAAEEIYQEILREDAGNLCALDGLGIIRCQNNDPVSGIRYFNEALHRLRKENPPNPRSEALLFFHLGLAYRSLENREEALKVLSVAEKLSPDEPDLLLNLGQVYYEIGQVNKAVESFQHLTEIQTDNVSAWLTLGYILFQQEQYNEAAKCLKTAELLDSESPEICLYLAESLRKAERFEESVPQYQKMLQVGADYPQAVHGFGKTLLALGQFADGWDAMEFRFASSLGTWERHQLPNWSPESNTQPLHVLAYSEEGLSAEVMFASCLPDLINSVEHCVVECDPALHHLFKRSFPRAEIVPLTSVNVDEQSNEWNLKLDAQIASGSLPRYFRRERFDFPLRKVYLVPDKEKIEKWSNKLTEIGGVKKIGVLWQGNWTAETPRQTTLPVTELRSLIAKHQDAAWVSLQNGSAQNELKQRSGIGPRVFPDIFQYDLDEMAALLTTLDLVITPPGYVSELAGALGVRTWLILPSGADWRHLIDVRNETAGSVSAKSVWHHSVEMYRQGFEQSWSNVFERIENDLKKFLVKEQPPEEIPTTIPFPNRHAASRSSTPFAAQRWAG